MYTFVNGIVWYCLVLIPGIAWYSMVEKKHDVRELKARNVINYCICRICHAKTFVEPLWRFGEKAVDSIHYVCVSPPYWKGRNWKI